MHNNYATFEDFEAAFKLEVDARRVARTFEHKLQQTPLRFKNPLRNQANAALDVVAACRKYTDETFDRLHVSDQQRVEEAFAKLDPDGEFI